MIMHLDLPSRLPKPKRGNVGQCFQPVHGGSWRCRADRLGGIFLGLRGTGSGCQSGLHRTRRDMGGSAALL